LPLFAEAAPFSMPSHKGNWTPALDFPSPRPSEKKGWKGPGEKKSNTDKDFFPIDVFIISCFFALVNATPSQQK
jgi:hypothetical protein